MAMPILAVSLLGFNDHKYVDRYQIQLTKYSIPVLEFEIEFRDNLELRNARPESAFEIRRQSAKRVDRVEKVEFPGLARAIGLGENNSGPPSHAKVVLFNRPVRFLV
jgi:hypothetical protein